ncbi:hypothetical protein [Streptomyces gobiensis]|uniref:hypothetical protein n=1 Tax=Streptomyces gobiensis TaxID=2875706 RepID=UPI001E640EE4|nr:hypothetical protein [Streptomyces gobiensis]UGY94050.1 hypothetical protein test1122_21590 [Streptomyces gobiensis]
MYNNEMRPTRREFRTRSLADTFRYNPELEAVERLQRERPDQFDTLNPTVKVELANYKTVRAAAKELGRDVSAPQND